MSGGGRSRGRTAVTNEHVKPRAHAREKSNLRFQRSGVSKPTNHQTLSPRVQSRNAAGRFKRRKTRAQQFRLACKRAKMFDRFDKRGINFPNFSISDKFYCSILQRFLDDRLNLFRKEYLFCELDRDDFSFIYISFLMCVFLC